MGKFKGNFRKEPWFGIDQIAMLERILIPQSVVLETGAGASTLWLAERAATVRSFEHMGDWYDAVKEELKRREIRNVILSLVPEYPGRGIVGLKDSFDLVIIDGRGRVRSVATTHKYVKKGGWLMLDDANRPRYAKAVNLLTILGWARRDFLSRTQPENKRNFTSFWRRPKGK